jgi:hypothetical protein
VLPGQAADDLAGLLVGPGGDGASVHDHQVRSASSRAPPQTREFLLSRLCRNGSLAAEGNMEKTVEGLVCFRYYFQGLR